MYDFTKSSRIIRDRRREKGISQMKLAEMAGVSKNTVENFERGECDSKHSTVMNLALALEMNVGELDSNDVEKP